MGFEPTTSSLARRRSTAELLPHYRPSETRMHRGIHSSFDDEGVEPLSGGPQVQPWHQTLFYSLCLPSSTHLPFFCLPGSTGLRLPCLTMPVPGTAFFTATFQRTDLTPPHRGGSSPGFAIQPSLSPLCNCFETSILLFPALLNRAVIPIGNTTGGRGGRCQTEENVK